jgi:hypothetical protein
MKEEAEIKRRFELVSGELNERSRRLVAGSRGSGDRVGRDLRRLTRDGTLPQGHQPRDPGTAGEGRGR